MPRGTTVVTLLALTGTTLAQNEDGDASCNKAEMLATGCKGATDCLFPCIGATACYVRCALAADNTVTPVVVPCAAGTQFNATAKACSPYDSNYSISVSGLPMATLFPTAFAAFPSGLPTSMLTLISSEVASQPSVSMTMVPSITTTSASMKAASETASSMPTETSSHPHHHHHHHYHHYYQHPEWSHWIPWWSSSSWNRPSENTTTSKHWWQGWDHTGMSWPGTWNNTSGGSWFGRWDHAEDQSPARWNSSRIFWPGRMNMPWSGGQNVHL